MEISFVINLVWKVIFPFRENFQAAKQCLSSGETWVVSAAGSQNSIELERPGFTMPDHTPSCAAKDNFLAALVLACVKLWCTPELLKSVSSSRCGSSLLFLTLLMRYRGWYCCKVLHKIGLMAYECWKYHVSPCQTVPRSVLPKITSPLHPIWHVLR